MTCSSANNRLSDPTIPFFQLQENIATKISDHIYQEATQKKKKVLEPYVPQLILAEESTKATIRSPPNVKIHCSLLT